MSTTMSDKSWNGGGSSDGCDEEFDDDNSSTANSTNSTNNRRISGDLVLPPSGVITTHCVSTVIPPGRKKSQDPLQFVKIQAADLSKKAVEQIRLAEEEKITKEKIKEVEEEWQSNLLNWKSKRRVNHGIVSTDPFDEETSDKSSSKSRVKTFSEILNEKAKSGHRIGYNLQRYVDDEDDDFNHFIVNTNDDSDQQNGVTQTNDNKSSFCESSSSSSMISQSLSEEGKEESRPPALSNNTNNKNTTLITDTTSNNDSNSSSSASTSTSASATSYNKAITTSESSINSSLVNGKTINSNSSNTAVENGSEPNHASSSSSSSNLSSTTKKKIMGIVGGDEGGNERPTPTSSNSSNFHENSSRMSKSIVVGIRKNGVSNNRCNEQQDNDEDEHDEKKRSMEQQKNVWNYLLQQQEHQMTDEHLRQRQCRIHADDIEVDDEEDEGLNESGENDEENDLQRQEQLINFRAKLSAFENLAKYGPEHNNNNNNKKSSNNIINNNSLMSSLVTSLQHQKDQQHQLARESSSSTSSSTISSMSSSGINANGVPSSGGVMGCPTTTTTSSSSTSCNMLLKSQHTRNVGPSASTSSSTSSSSSSNTTNGSLKQPTTMTMTTQNPGYKQHWLIQEAELRRQIAAASQTKPMLPSKTTLMANGQVKNGILKQPQATQQSQSQSSSHAVTTSVNGSIHLSTSEPMYENFHHFSHHQSLPQVYQHQHPNQSSSTRGPTGAVMSVSISTSSLPQASSNHHQQPPLPPPTAHHYPVYSNESIANQVGYPQPYPGGPPALHQKTLYNPNHWVIQEAELARQMAASTIQPQHSLPSQNVSRPVAPPPHPSSIVASNPSNTNNGSHVIRNHNVITSQQPQYLAQSQPQIQTKQQPVTTTIGNNSGSTIEPMYENFNKSITQSVPLVHHVSNPSISSSQSIGHVQQGSAQPLPSQQSRQLVQPPHPIPVSNFHHPLPAMIQSSTVTPSMPPSTTMATSQQQMLPASSQQQKQNVLSVSGKKKCSRCGDELGRGCAAMVIESLSLYYHINCFRCSVCHIQLGNGSCGTDVRVRNHKLHCNNCYSNDEAGLKWSEV